jgi:hypothetical protein
MAAFGNQFSTGDQTDEARKKFHKNHFAKCVKCEKDTITESRHVAGCRLCGDAYGTTVFTCSSCKWTTSFQWDDASECFYYETRGWN